VAKLYETFFDAVAPAQHTLDLSNLAWGESEVCMLVEALPRFVSLESLDLSRNRAGAEGGKALAEALKVNTVLKSLSIAHNNISGEVAQQLAAVVLASKSLEVLSEVPIKELRADKLTTLELRGKGLGPTEGIVIAELLQGSTALTTLNLQGNSIGGYQEGYSIVYTPEGPAAIAKALEVNAAMTALDVGYNSLDEKVALDIVRTVRTNDRMTNLGLAGCKIGPMGAKEIAEYVQGSTTLKSLSITRNNINGEAAQELAAVVLASKSLEVLSEVPIKELRADKLTALELRGKGLDGPTEGIVIAELLKVSTAMTSIMLDGYALPLPVKQLKGTEAVETLNLSNDCLGPMSGIVIAKLIEFNTALTNLDVSSNQLGPAGGKAMAEMLKFNTALNKLNVGNNNMSDEGKQEWWDSVKGREGFELLV